MTPQTRGVAARSSWRSHEWVQMPPNSKCLSGYDPETLILVAGARPLMRPLQQQTWETFSVNWHTDVRVAFHWLREALLKPLQPGSRVVVVSSGAEGAGNSVRV